MLVLCGLEVLFREVCDGWPGSAGCFGRACSF